MLMLSPQISDAERAVNAYKHELLLRVMAHIVRRALVQTHVFAGDVPEDIVEAQHRQGVASNAWNALRSLEIIEALPLTYMDPERGIEGGCKRNTNMNSKGRRVTVYRLASLARARAWANANGIRLAEAELPASEPVQVDLTLN